MTSHQPARAPLSSTLAELVAARARSSPESPALLSVEGEALTYAGLQEQLEATARALAQAGIGPGDAVALIIPNGPLAASAFLSVASASACAPLNPDYRAAELEFHLKDLQAAAIVVDEGSRSVAIEVARALGLTILRATPREAAPARFGLVAERSRTAVNARPPTAGDIALLLHTSGTTARPKLVPLTHANLCATAANVARVTALSHADRCLNVMPIFHVQGAAGVLVSSVAAGASVICTRGFEPETFGACLERLAPTWYSASPTIHLAALALVRTTPERFHRSTLRMIRSLSAPLAPQTMADLEEAFGAPVIESYGLTEAATQVCSNPLPPGRRKPGSVGPAAGPEVTLLDDAGNPVAAGAEGEIAIRGANVMAGYLHNPEANDQAFVDGWFRTGDLGRFDADGYLYVTGRSKEIINRGGEKIAPREVDEVLLAHPAVAEAAAFSMPHANLGEEVAAAVVLRAGNSASEAELLEHCRERLADYKAPKRLVLVGELPRGPTGKVVRTGLVSLLSEPSPGGAARGYVAPSTELEKVLAAIWSSVLGLKRVGVSDRFFELGGNSMLILRAVHASVLAGLSVTPRLMYQQQTIAQLASALGSAPAKAVPAREARKGAQRGGSEAKLPPLVRVEHGAQMPLSYAQERLWILEQLSPGEATYNLPWALRVMGPLDVAALRTSLQVLVDRHESLRTTVTSIDGVPVQRVSPEMDLSFDVLDLSGLAEKEREAQANAYLRHEAARPFDLERGPVFRAGLLRLADGHHVLWTNVHHAFSDGWSRRVLWRDMKAAYTALTNKKEPALPPLPVRYADYAVWQRRWLKGETLDQQLSYWKERLRGVEPLDLPPDRSRPRVQSHRGARVSFEVEDGLRRKLEALSRQADCSLFMTLLACFQTLLYRYTSQADLSVGVPVAGRIVPELDGLVGFFVNTVVLRAELSGAQTFRGLLLKTKQLALEGYSHQDVPFEKLVAELNPPRDSSRSPLFQVMFQLWDGDEGAGRLGEASCRPIAVDAGAEPFDLSCHIRRTKDRLEAGLNYATDLFDEATIETLVGHYLRLLEAVVDRPDARIDELSLMSDAERQKVLVEWNATGVDGQKNDEVLVHRLFEDTARQHPDKVAVVGRDGALTYAELDSRANQLAHELIARGVKPDERVGVALERSLDLIVALLGILKAGGGYMPLNLEWPAQRLAFMLDDASVRLVIATRSTVQRLPSGNHQTLRLDDEAAGIAARPAQPPAVPLTCTNLAYVLYTSGSTGVPKGVEVAHRAIDRLVRHVTYVSLGPSEVLLHAAPLTFDASTFEIWAALLNGSTLVLYPDAVPTAEGIREVIRRHRVTTMLFASAIFNAIIDEDPTAFAGVTQLLTGGEALSVSHVRRAYQALPGVQLLNVYGPTETTTFATVHTIPRQTPEGASSIPIGRPIRSTKVYVLNEALEVLGVRQPGELFIGGHGLARGYLNRPELTSERFVTVRGERLYRSGDIVRWLPDGTLDFLGRSDQQVKVRGLRIELGEVEAVLLAQPDVKEAVVAALVPPSGGKQLVAYVVPHPGRAPRPEPLRAALKATLPEYMVPSAFMLLDKVPLTSSGKVDRKALPAPEWKGEAARFVAPRTPVEEALCAIWARALRLQRVGVHDNFFELGGDSILALRMVAAAQAAGVAFTVRQLFDRQTVAELAEVARGAQAIETQTQVEGEVPLTPIQRWLFELAGPQLHHFNQSMVLETEGPVDVSLATRAVDALVAHHDALRLRYQRRGDGWSQAHADVGAAQVESVALPEGDEGASLGDVAKRLHRGLNLTDGPLVRVAVVAQAARPTRLVFVIHHLVVDGVSWRILKEDFEAAYAQLASGRPVQLPPKTASFKKWAVELEAYAQSKGLRSEVELWVGTLASGAPRLPVDFPGGDDTAARSRTVSVELDEAETKALLRDAPAAYHTQVNDILLTALSQALLGWVGGDVVSFDLEGHGREDVLGVDVSRTVGWFTSKFPVCIRLERDVRPAEAIKSVKEQLRAVPRRGVGYGVLRHLVSDERIRAWPEPEVAFNYLGQLDEAVDEAQRFLQAPSLGAAAVGDRQPRGHPLSINGSVTRGSLRLGFTFSEGLHRVGTIEGVAATFIDALRVLIRHCVSADAGGPTRSAPSDASVTPLQPSALEQSHATARDEPLGVERAPAEVWAAGVWPLSFTEERFFRRYLAHGGSRDSHRSHLVLLGPLNVERLRRAFEEVVDAHAVLRSRYTRQGDQLHRTIATPAPFELPVQDVGGEPGHLDEWLAAKGDAWELTGGEMLLRAALARLQPNRHVLRLEMPHIVFDGYCWGILWKELAVRHAAKASGSTAQAPALQYPDFAHWQRRHYVGEVVERGREWFLGHVDGASPLSRVAATDHDRRPLEAARASDPLALSPAVAASHDVAADVVQQLQRLARSAGGDLPSLFIAAFAAVLRSARGAERVVVSTVMTARTGVYGVAELLGNFLSSMPVVVDVSGAPTFAGVARRVSQQLNDVRSHTDFPVIPLVFPTASDFQRTQFNFTREEPPPAWPGLGTERLSAAARRRPRSTEQSSLLIDIMIEVLARGDGSASMTLMLNGSLWEQESASRLLAEVADLLALGAREPTTSLETLLARVR